MNILIKLLLLLSAWFCPFSAVAETTLTIYYTASLNGNLDGCNCDMNPAAGLVKRAAFLRNLQPPGPALILEAGDIFDEYPDPDLERHILEVYEELGYDAVALGDQELAAGRQSLLLYEEEFPLLCHNLFIRKDGSTGTASEGDLFTPAPVVIGRRGLRIGILSLIDPAVVPRSSASRFRIAAPIAVAETMLRLCDRLDLDLTVVLYHGSFQSAVKLANTCPGIDVVIFAHEQQLVAPRMIGTTVITSPGEEGNRLGILTLHLGPGGIKSFQSEFRFFSYVKDPDDPSVRSRIDSYRKKLRSYLY
jgi:2',3'-cyclic-nucleotide 2'-phosphodiesterase (5'-nucleotidase family)